MLRSPWARLGLFAGLLAIAAVVVAFTGLPTPDEVRDRADDAGAAGPILFALTFALLGLLPVPLAPLSIAAGALFGFWVALGTVLGAGIVSASATFAISRALGRPAVVSVSGARVARLDARLERSGLATVIALRLVPIMPFTLCNYACGLTVIPFRTYLIGTALGIVPGSGAYVAVGAFGGDPGSLEFLVALIGLALLTIVGLTMSAELPPHASEGRLRAVRGCCGRPRTAAPPGPSSHPGSLTSRARTAADLRRSRGDRRGRGIVERDRELPAGVRAHPAVHPGRPAKRVGVGRRHPRGLPALAERDRPGDAALGRGRHS